MDEQPAAAKPTVEDLLERLVCMLRQTPGGADKMVRGEVGLVIARHEPAEWILDLHEGHGVTLAPGRPERPLFRIGMTRSVLRWFIEGTLDVERAFKERRLAVEGDLRALGRLVSSLEPAQSVLGVRTGR